MCNLVFGFNFNLIFQSYYYLRGHFGSHISHLGKTYLFLALEVPPIVSGKVWKSRAGHLMAGGSRNKCACALLAPLFHLDSTGVSSHWAGAAHVQDVSALFCQSGDAVPDMPTSPLTSQSSG